MSSPLILASASPRRADLLRQMGIDFEIVPSSAEEIHDEKIPVRTLCELNAEKKAMAVAEKIPERLVLGADTLVALGQKIYGKPRDLVEARRMLSELSGKTHQVITGVALVQFACQKKVIFSEVTEVTFLSLTPKQIDSYIEKVHILDKAGAYAIQENGEMIVERISGSYSNVVGLPVEALRENLASFA